MMSLLQKIGRVFRLYPMAVACQPIWLLFVNDASTTDSLSLSVCNYTCIERFRLPDNPLFTHAPPEMDAIPSKVGEVSLRTGGAESHGHRN